MLTLTALAPLSRSASEPRARALEALVSGFRLADLSEELGSSIILEEL
jgi:hypothetical protein